MNRTSFVQRVLRVGLHRVHAEWQRPLSNVDSIMMEKLAQAELYAVQRRWTPPPPWVVFGRAGGVRCGEGGVEEEF